MRKFMLPLPLVSFLIPYTNKKIVLYYKGLADCILKPYHIRLLYSFNKTGYVKPYGVCTELFFVQIEIFDDKPDTEFIIASREPEKKE